MIETIEQMTCEELTAAYVILRDLENKSKIANDLDSFIDYIKMLQGITIKTHQEKLEDMRREFYEKGENNVQH